MMPRTGVAFIDNISEALPCIDNVKAESILQEQIVLTTASFAEIVVWKLSTSLPGSRHRFR
jgi:hypothetical protein